MSNTEFEYSLENTGLNNEIKAALDAVRATTPLVHNITNNVTINDCANADLAIGASPIMGDEVKDVVEITQICNSLVLNIGTLCDSTIAAMMGAGHRASELEHPLVLDPVGAGASAIRTETASKILDEMNVTVVRGNMSEIKALASGSTSTRGVDACPEDAVTRENLPESAAFARAFAKSAGVVVAITGAIDIVASADRAVAIFNGSPMQGRITGAGCMLSSITGAFVAAEKDPFIAAVAAVASMGVAGQVAEGRMGELDGNGSYRTYLLDALFNITGDSLAQAAKLEEIA